MDQIALLAEQIAVAPTAARLLDALTLLREARDAAHELGRDVWEFAVELGELRDRGVTGADLRRLLCAGCVEQGVERLRRGPGPRAFRRVANLALPAATCFVLTAAGARLASRLAEKGARSFAGDAGAPPAAPWWDGGVRRLTWGGRLVKEYRLPAPNQEAILAAFQEEGWPARIDDPLRQSRVQDPKLRLHDAVKGLNRNQVHPLLHFGGDGTGRGVMWRNRNGSA